MAEVRTTSSTGGQKGTKLARFDLIPQGPLNEIAEHFGMGAIKYANHQWRQGYEWSKSFAAKQRHDSLFWAGYDYDVCSNDPEGCKHVDEDGNEYVPVRPDTCFNHTGSHHMAASAWHALVLLEFKDRFPAFDDRYDPAEDDQKYRDATEPSAELGPLGGFTAEGLSGEYWLPDRPAGEPKPLGPEWQELGYTDEDGLPPILAEYVDRMYSQWFRPLLGREAGFVVTPETQVEIDWKDPALPTAAAMQDAINKVIRGAWAAEHYVFPRVVFPRVDTARFTGHVHGAETEDMRLIELADVGLLRKHRVLTDEEYEDRFGGPRWVDQLNDSALDTVGDDY